MTIGTVEQSAVCSKKKQGGSSEPPRRSWTRARTVDMDAKGEPRRRSPSQISSTTNGCPLPIQGTLQQIVPMGRQLHQRERLPVPSAGVLGGLSLVRDDSHDDVLHERIALAEPYKKMLAELEKRRLKVSIDSIGVGTKLFDRWLPHPTDGSKDFVKLLAAIDDRGAAFSIAITDGPHSTSRYSRSSWETSTPLWAPSEPTRRTCLGTKSGSSRTWA